jgi:glucose-1-phosphate adenylyltransferase
MLAPRLTVRGACLNNPRMDDCIAVILGGGRGARLFPLTQHRSKPAVPIAGKYRLIDIPISNCLNVGLRRIFVLTQYNSQSLNKHISRTYKFDGFSEGFVTILAAEQTEESPEWFQGTADAVRQSLRHIRAYRARDVLVLSGDQLYQGDFRKLLSTHRNSEADATVAVIPVSREQTAGLGILKVDATGRIVEFAEKPPPERLDALESDIPGYGRGFLASMGIYMFTREMLLASVANPELVDFGRHVIPGVIRDRRVQSHIYRGYWEDVGTISSYFQANLELTERIPRFDFYDAHRPVYTRSRVLPATKAEGSMIRSALVSEGCILLGVDVERSVIGIRSRIGAGTRLREVLALGADFYETLEEIERAHANGLPPIGIGAGSVIERAIIDRNSRVGSGVSITNPDKIETLDGDGYYIREGIVIVPKDGVIPDGTVI